MISIDDLFSLNAWPGYADMVQTPHMDAFAASSYNFTQAFAEVALCNPSRSATLSGKSPWTTGVIDNATSIFDAVPVEDLLPGRLNSAGFDVTVGGKVFHNTNDPRLDAVLAGRLDDSGFRNGTVPDGGAVEGVAYGPSGDLTLGDSVLTDAVIAFLQADHPDPFALAAGIYRPHADWIVPQQFFDLYDPSQIEVPYFATSDDAADFYYALTGNYFHMQVLENDAWVDLIHAYFASVSYADYLFGQIVDAVAASGYADNTHIVMWSDHGYHLGDRGLWAKFTLWEQSGRAPLMIKMAGQETGQDIDTAVSLTDIFPTVLELAGAPADPTTQANSLLPLMTGQPDAFAGDGAITWMYGGVSYRSDEFRYIRDADGTEHLYHMASDPLQLTNLIEDAAYATELASHRAKILDAAPGFHLVFGSAGNDDLAGTAGDDIFILGPGQDTASGGLGNDIYLSDEAAVIVEAKDQGHDTLIVSGSFVLPRHVEDLRLQIDSADATLRGNALDNLIAGGVNADTAFGGGGNDVIDIRFGDDLVYGGGGDDTLLLSNGDDTAYGNTGFDSSWGGVGNDVIYGGSGADTLDGAGGTDTVFGGSGNDYLFAGAGAFDHVFGGGGDDLIDLVFGGKNTAVGGQGNDTVLTGPVGLATVTLGGGHDQVTSKGAMLVAYGGDGRDVMIGGAQSDNLRGGLGRDTLDGGGGADQLFGGVGHDTLLFGDSPTHNARAYGGTGDDEIAGGSFGDGWFYGGTGHDQISGGRGSATLWGGQGDDQLRASVGKSTLFGGLGEDEFRIGSSFEGVARIRGFEVGVDQLLLNRDFKETGESAADLAARLGEDFDNRVVLTLADGRIIVHDITLDDLRNNIDFA